MRKMRFLVVAVMVAASSLLVAAPAQACDTELGDMCKVVDVARDTVCFGKHQYYLAFCQT